MTFQKSFKTMNLIRIVRKTSILSSIFLAIASLSINVNPAQSQQRACVINDNADTVCGKLTSTKKETKKNTQVPVYRKEVDNFVFLLKGCKKSDTTVKCDLIVTNKGKERNLWIVSQYPSKDSKFIDSEGKAYLVSAIEIGGKKTNEYVKVIPDIDYTTIVTFEDVPDKISQAKVLELNLVNNGIIQFKNISFSN
jgi:hypothetical protein